MTALNIMKLSYWGMSHVDALINTIKSWWETAPSSVAFRNYTHYYTTNKLLLC